MSENNRAQALAGALTLNSNGTAEEVLATAEAFLAFLSGEEAEATPVKAAKPAKSPKSPPKPEPEKDEAEAVSKQLVGEAVEKLLGANKRAEAVALMKKFKATSVSSLDEKHYAAFLEEADALLMTA